MSDQKKNAPRASGSEGINDMSDINDIIPQKPTDESSAQPIQDKVFSFSITESASKVSQTVLDMISEIIKQREQLNRQLDDIMSALETPFNEASKAMTELASEIDRTNDQFQETIEAMNQVREKNLTTYIHPDLKTAEDVYRKLLLYYDDVIAIDPELEYASIFDRGFLLKAAEIARNSGEDIPRLLIEPKEYRTRKKAISANVKETPRSLSIITLPGYHNGLSFYADPTGKAHLQAIKDIDDKQYLKFENGQIFIEGAPATAAQLQDINTKQNIENIDLPSLQSLYSIILYNAALAGDYEHLQPFIKLHVANLAAFMGIDVSKRGLNRNDIERLIEKTQSFHNVVGVITENRNGKPSQSYFPVLNFEGYDDSDATISISSPYMNRLIKKIYTENIRRKKDGSPQISKAGKISRLPSHSYLVHPSIIKQRNRAAILNVITIVALIEQAGKNTPHITARKLITQNIALNQRLQESARPNQLLDRVFRATWRILRDDTDLEKTYKDIRLPDPDDVTAIPTMDTLDMRFDFPHNGKREADPGQKEQ